MSEIINQTPSPEQVVFGTAFSFANGESDEETQSAFFAERLKSIKEGTKTWLPRALNTDTGICADLFKDKEVVATLDFDYADYTASVYVTSASGSFGDTVLCSNVTFDEAVYYADQYISGQKA